MKKLLNAMVVIIMSLGVSMAENQKSRPHYQMMLKVNNMSCVIKLNGMYLMDTMDITSKVPQLISLSQAISEYMNEGINTLTLEGINEAPYVKDPENGYCDVAIVAMVKHPETGNVESKEVSHLRFTYAENENPQNLPYDANLLTLVETRRDQEPLIATSSVSLKELPPLFDARKMPIERKLASREITVNHQQPFSWVHQSTPFTDTPENRQKLWNKYNEIRTAIVKKDKKAIRRLAEPGVTDVANFQRDDVERHFNIVFSQTLEEFFNINPEFWESKPLTMDDYDLELYADGKLFRFNEKKKTLFSPLQWYNPFRSTYKAYNPLFTYINGEIVMATF